MARDAARWLTKRSLIRTWPHDDDAIDRGMSLRPPRVMLTDEIRNPRQKSGFEQSRFLFWSHTQARTDVRTHARLWMDGCTLVHALTQHTHTKSNHLHFFPFFIQRNLGRNFLWFFFFLTNCQLLIIQGLRKSFFVDCLTIFTRGFKLGIWYKIKSHISKD